MHLSALEWNVWSHNAAAVQVVHSRMLRLSSWVLVSRVISVLAVLLVRFASEFDMDVEIVLNWILAISEGEYFW